MARIQADAEQLQQAYEAVKDDPQWSESCELIARGQLPSEMFRALAVRPDLLQAMSAFSAPLYPGGLLERELQEKVVVAVSEANACQYCIESHRGTLRRSGIDPAPQTPRERAALGYVDAAIANPPRVTDELWRATREQFTDSELVELTLLIGMTAMLNRFNDCLEVRYNDDYG